MKKTDEKGREIYQETRKPISHKEINEIDEKFKPLLGFIDTEKSYVKIRTSGKNDSWVNVEIIEENKLK